MIWRCRRGSSQGESARDDKKLRVMTRSLGREAVKHEAILDWNTDSNIRGAHIMFCNIDQLITSLFCFSHYIIDQFRNTCDKNNLLDSVQPFSFHATKCPVRVTDLLPAVSNFWEGIFRLWCVITTARENLFKSAFKVYSNFFGDQSPSKATIFRWFRQFISGPRRFHIWTENVGRWWPLWSNGNDRYPRKHLLGRVPD